MVRIVTMAEYWGWSVVDDSIVLGGEYHVSSNEYGSGEEYSSGEGVGVS